MHPDVLTVPPHRGILVPFTADPVLRAYRRGLLGFADVDVFTDTEVERWDMSVGY